MQIKKSKKYHLIIFLLVLNLIFCTLWCFASETDTIDEYNQRVVLLELFVQANCTTCPHVEFCLEDLSWEYGAGKVILVEEHLWDDGYDIEATNERYNWYVPGMDKGTPDLFINGSNQRIQGLVCNDLGENYKYYQKVIDSEAAKIAKIQLTVLKKYENSKMKISGKIKNICALDTENLVVSGMIYLEGQEPGLAYWVKEIFSFQNVPFIPPMKSIDFEFISELQLMDEEKDLFHAVIFIQDVITKEVLQAVYVE